MKWFEWHQIQSSSEQSRQQHQQHLQPHQSSSSSSSSSSWISSLKIFPIESESETNFSIWLFKFVSTLLLLNPIVLIISYCFHSLNFITKKAIDMILTNNENRSIALPLESDDNNKKTSKNLMMLNEEKMENKSDNINDENYELLKKKIRERLEFINTKGKTARGISDNVDPDQPPVWFEKDSFEHAQNLFKTYKVIIRISQLLGLNLVLNFTHGLVPLLVTGNSRTISKLFVRYLSTMMHVTNWFEFDPFDKESKSYRSLKMVRGMHKKVSTKMNLEGNLSEDGETTLWIPQYGMCHAQFSFIGFMTIFPKQLGFHNFTKKDFHSMFHFWRVIGYCLGTDDQFNLCSGTDEETFELCRQIYFDHWLPVINMKQEKVGVEMSKGIVLAMAKVNPNLDYNAMMRYCSKFLQLNPDDFPLETFRQKFLYAVYYFGLNYGTRSKSCNRLLSYIGEIRMKNAIKNRRKHEEDLKEQYPNITFENDRCPFDVNFNYVTAVESYGEK